MQCILDSFFYLRTLLMNYIIFFSIRLYALEHTFEEVKERTKDQDVDHRLNLDWGA